MSDYLGAFLFSFGVRMCILMAIGITLSAIFPEMSLLLFAAGAAVPSAISAHKNANE